jgi:hypothetical protein
MQTLREATAPRATVRPAAPRPDEGWARRQADAAKRAAAELRSLLADARAREDALAGELREALDRVRSQIRAAARVTPSCARAPGARHAAGTLSSARSCSLQ